MLLALLFVGVVSSMGGATRAARVSEPRWVMHDLGTLGGAESVASALNDRGQVAGWSRTGSGAVHLFLWENGRMRDLGVPVADYAPVVMNNRGQIAGSRPDRSVFVWQGGTLRAVTAPGAGLTRPADINEAGQVVGTSSTGRAFRWQNGRLRFLPALRGSVGMDAVAVNEKGQIVGSARQRNGLPHAVEWDAEGRLIDLGSLKPTGKTSTAIAINESGQVVGSTQVAEIYGQAALWSNGKLFRLRPLRSGDNNYAVDINRSGLILVFSYPVGLGRAENARAFLWKGTQVSSLGTLTSECYDGCDTTPNALNDAGQVVGMTRRGSGPDHAFVWQDGHMHDLGVLPGSGASSVATAINSHNQIIGTSAVDGKSHAVLWALTRG